MILKIQSGLLHMGKKTRYWNTKENGTGTSYAINDAYTGTADLTLYAQWEGKTYRIYYQLNGGTINGNYATSYQYGTLTTLPQSPINSAVSFIPSQID